VTVTKVGKIEGLAQKAAREAIKQTALKNPTFFAARYWRDERGRPINPKPFHLLLLETVLDISDPTPVMIKVPFEHGKTTNVSQIAPILAMIRDPNIRIMHIMNNDTDAGMNAAAIRTRLMAVDSDLVKDFGPFKGDRWGADGFNVAGRTIVDIWPTFSSFGTGSNIFGHRADLVICDDILNLDNSGPNVTQETRDAVKQWFLDAVMKIGGKVVVVGTPMDHRDLYTELEKPQYGFKVIKLRGIINDETKEVLWPEKHPWEELDRHRQMDLRSFMRRVQMEAIEETALSFPLDSLMLCRNFKRSWGEISKEMQDSHENVVINSFDPTSGQTKDSKWCGFWSMAFNPKAQDPKRWHVLEVDHFRAPFEVTDEEKAKGEFGQVEFLIDRHERYGAYVTVIEANGAHQFLLQSQKLRKFRDSGHLVVPHFTDKKNKPDPITGVAGLSPIVKALLIDFPFADEISRRKVTDFIEGEAAKYPQVDITDRIMAWWFGWFYATKNMIGFRKAVRRDLPGWTRGAGLGQGFQRKVIMP
jgi:hypothetical protein